jgi:hypothetical protein
MGNLPIRPVRIEGDVAYVPLTRGYEAIIDVEDTVIVGGMNWYVKVGTHSNYAIRSEKKFRVYMHRLILNAPDNLHVDHVNGNGLDNRKSNLRVVTVSQNQHNRGLQVNNKSGYKGVTWYGRTGKWMAQIQSLNTYKCLGYFDTAEDAHNAYCEAAKELHGEFARFE